MQYNITSKQVHNDLTSLIIGVAIDIHSELGPGLLESSYHKILALELRDKGLSIREQQAIPLIWKKQSIGFAYKADIIVEDMIIIEIKSVENVLAVHKKQLLTYLKLSRLKLGLLINFNENYLKDGLTRIINGKL